MSDFLPIEPERVDIALRLRRDHMTDWADAANVLYAMRNSLNGTSDAAVLGRVAAVNSLYNAGLGSAVLEMVRHIQELERAAPLKLRDGSPAVVVEDIAFLPRRNTDAPGCQVFASKYAHFFLSPERYPIYDQHAARALMRHNGRLVAGMLDGKHRYSLFCDLLESVVKRSPKLVRPHYGDLDAYLWLVGIYREWHRKRLGLKYRDINRASAVFFKKHWDTGDEVGVLLAGLVDHDSFFAVIPDAPSAPS